MTQAGYRHRIIIQDRSGSMSDILPGANAWKMSASYLSRTPVAASASAVVLDLTDDERALGESGADNE